MRDNHLCFIIYIFGIFVSRHATNGSTSLVSTSSQVPSSPTSSIVSSAITTSLTSSTMMLTSSTVMSSMLSSSTPSSSSSMLMSTGSTIMSSMLSSFTPSSSSSMLMSTSSTIISSSMVTSSTMVSSRIEASSTTTVSPSSRIMPSSSSSAMPSVTPTPEPTPEPTTTPEPIPSPETNSNVESDFGRVGFVAFGIMFAIAVILLVILIVVIVRGRKKSGSYLTGEAPGSKRINDGGHMTFGLNNGGFDNVETIDLDKDERQLSGGGGVTSFSNLDENVTQVKNDEPKQEVKVVEPPILKFADDGSTNNLLTDNDPGNRQSGGKQDLAAMIGIKVEPSSGASVESLQDMKDTDKLMGKRDDKDSDEDSESSDIDDDLPLPALSESDNEDHQTEV